ncbi:hypothetical protein K493DRAFT_312964 [Basidiobolus meristosporus CBS 931.73]|uniref:Uncharacterized protein n=1 Tax=Basidiobolus meristosporus CBS 931.73 TaxID=1314790 RepID=A0A1Y1YQ22_9FUNG|nr:hypothetical protein K493DRAFT_322012 [Basidiobolus meristosporus CBS 931.73]ORY00066.1 hypothetical protein K493DRAFT_312964 [Basidiobolus meristosporus CBS 931.73]|eukprot:ORX64187.1 hypothetical protein K493DRAFT_322012 [Basidiobolus meristosporus CBS 931.73]
MVTLAILSGLICFTPVFVILSIRGTDENATYAAVLNSTRVHDPSDTTGPTSKSSSATTVEEIKLEHNGSQQPLKTDIQLDPAGSDTSILIPASPSTASSISQEPSPVKPLPSVKPKYQPAFTPLSPPPRPYMKREYSDTLEEVPNVPLALDHESIVMERCQEVRAGEHSNCVVDWRPSFGHSDESDGSEVDQSSTN